MIFISFWSNSPKYKVLARLVNAADQIYVKQSAEIAARVQQSFPYHKVPRHIHWAANTLRKYLVTLPILFFVYYLSGLVLIGFILGGVIVQVDNNALKLFAFMWHFLIMCVLVWMLALVVWIYRT